jgi:predicted molibdopterin-dependent oxidoreductase YjgC
MGENPIRSLPQSDRVRKAFEKIEYIIVQDIIANETTQVADVVLPGAAFSEKSGSFTNMEGRLQMFSPVAQPPGQAKTDLEIIGLIAERMKPGEKYGSIEKIREEINRIVPLYSGTDINQHSIFLNDTDQNQNSGSDEKNEGIPFSPVFSTKDEPSDKHYPFTAILGHMHYHLGSGTRTCHSAAISEMVCKGEVEISHEDSSKLEFKDGDMVRITSRFGSIQRAVRIEKMLSSGLIFVPLAVSSNDARGLVQLNELFKSDSDSWDTCRVKVEKIKE